jgi:hypothetical protein
MMLSVEPESFQQFDESFQRSCDFVFLATSHEFDSIADVESKSLSFASFDYHDCLPLVGDHSDSPKNLCVEDELGRLWESGDGKAFFDTDYQLEDIANVIDHFNRRFSFETEVKVLLSSISNHSLPAESN